MSKPACLSTFYLRSRAELGARSNVVVFYECVFWSVCGPLLFTVFEAEAGANGAS